MGWKANIAIAAGLMIVAAAVERAAAERRRHDKADTSHALDRIRALYDRGAVRYDRAMAVLDAWIFADSRRWVAEQAHGSVLELAAGSGRNFRYYPPTARVTAQDLSLVMLQRARTRAAAAGIPVHLQAGDAQSLAFGDARFDAVVCTLGLCTIPDERRALREAWRVLRPGGRLLLLEHVRSAHPVVYAAQRILDPIVCLLARDHLLRDPLDLVVGAGFEVLHVDRLALNTIERLSACKPLQI